MGDKPAVVEAREAAFGVVAEGGLPQPPVDDVGQAVEGVVPVAGGLALGVPPVRQAAEPVKAKRVARPSALVTAVTRPRASNPKVTGLFSAL